MSADNGVYIHKFRNGWKVTHAQAIDNIHWKADKSGYNTKVLRAYFKKSPLFKTKEEALVYAHELHEEIGYTEYGVSVV